MRDISLILILLGIITALFASKIDTIAKNNVIFKTSLIVSIIALVLFIGITLFNLTK